MKSQKKSSHFAGHFGQRTTLIVSGVLSLSGCFAAVPEQGASAAVKWMEAGGIMQLTLLF
jgi:hypothetical protein